MRLSVLGGEEITRGSAEPSVHRAAEISQVAMAFPLMPRLGASPRLGLSPPWQRRRKALLTELWQHVWEDRRGGRMESPYFKSKGARLGGVGPHSVRIPVA